MQPAARDGAPRVIFVEHPVAAPSRGGRPDHDFRRNRTMTRTLLAAAGSVTAFAALGQTAPSLEACAAIEADRDRLACYDRLARPTPPAIPSAPSTAAGAPAGAASGVGSSPAARSALGERWAIDIADGLVVRPHEPTYLLFARVSDRVNQRPASPTRPGGPVDINLQDTEAKFQLSFKFRVLYFDDVRAPDVWVGYTQQSQWQVFNSDLSRPFRETNYAPELMFAWHPDTYVGPFRWRLLNVGLIHQSNGRSQIISRSWNRIYAQFGLESGGWTMLVRPWVRVNEDEAKDDNPDITDYLARGDLVLSYAWREHTFATKLRQNFSTGRGYAEGTWSFPLVRGLRGYLQATSGYGESMIDYNWRQNTIGLGVSLFDWQ
jgi:phospholipase A1